MTAAALKEAVTGKSQQPPAGEPTPYERFRTYVQNTSFLHDIALLVGGEVQARTFVRVVLTAVQQTPRLLEANRRTLLLACMKAARDKLMPDGKEAVLNIYNTKVKDEHGRDTWVEAVQYLPMTAGLIKKMYDSGFVKMVDAAAVYEKDEFTYERGDVPKLVHRPTLADDPGKIIAAYVVVTLTSGEIKREVMARRDIEKVRTASKAPDGLMWKTYYDQGAIKSTIKRAYKQLPSSVELEQVIAHDNDAMGYREAPIGASADEFAEPIPAAAPPEAKPAALEHNPAETIPQQVSGGRAPETIDAKAEAAKPKPKAQAKDAAKGPTYSEVATMIANAKGTDDLMAALDLVPSVADPAHRRQLNLDIQDRRIALAEPTPGSGDVPQ